MWSYLAIVLVAFLVVCISMQGSESYISVAPTTGSTQPAPEGVVLSKVESETGTESSAVVVRDDGPPEGPSFGVSGQSKVEKEDAPASNDLDALDVHATVPETEEKLPDQPSPAEADSHSEDQDDGDSNEGEASEAESGEGKSSSNGGGSEVGEEKDRGDEGASPAANPDLPDMGGEQKPLHSSCLLWAVGSGRLSRLTPCGGGRQGAHPACSRHAPSATREEADRPFQGTPRRLGLKRRAEDVCLNGMLTRSL